MSSTVYGTPTSYLGLAKLATQGSAVYESGIDYINPYRRTGDVVTYEWVALGGYPFPTPGGVQAFFINKCIDGVTGQWTFWETSFQDVNGTKYPGASFDGGTYRVLSIKYDREGI